MAGVAGFEPTNDGVRVRCLTAWRHPNLFYRARFSRSRGPKRFPLPKAERNAPSTFLDYSKNRENYQAFLRYFPKIFRGDALCQTSCVHGVGSKGGSGRRTREKTGEATSRMGEASIAQTRGKGKQTSQKWGAKSASALRGENFLDKPPPRMLQSIMTP